MEGILIFDSTQIRLEDILPFVNSFCGVSKDQGGLNAKYHT